MIKNISYLILISSTLFSSDLYLPSIVIQSSKSDTDKQMQLAQTINIIDEEQLKTLNIENIEDFSARIPNANISGIGNRTDKTFTFRGISNYVTAESSVAMYIDDVAVPFSYGYGVLDTNNISSIEFQKGPQGVMFGKNAESGVINIYTKPTAKDLEGEIKAGVATYNTKEFYSRVSNSINDKLQFALSLSKNSTDGYSKNTLTENHFDKRDLIGFSTKLDYKFDDNLDASIKYSKMNTDDGGSPFKINTKENPFEIDTELTDDFVKTKNDLLSLVIKHKNKDTTFTSVSSYAKQNIKKEDYVGILGGLVLDYDIDIEEVSQEFRVNQRFENMDFLAGLFYSDKINFKYNETQTLKAFSAVSVNKLQNLDTNHALFTKADFYGDHNFIFSVGLRYQKTKRDFSRDLNKFFEISNQANSTTTWSHILPTLSLAYFAEDNSQIYLTYSKGYRPGGYNYREDTAILTPFKPEETDSFELGYKNEFDKSFFINTALFYNNIKDLRINTFDNNLGSTTYNANKAHSYGLELDLKYTSDTFDIYSRVGITQAKIKRFDTNKIYENNTLMDVPNLTASLGLKYKINKRLYSQSDITYIGKRYYNIDNSAKESGYHTVNTAIGYKQNKWHTLLYVNNIFNKEAVDFRISTPSNEYYHFNKPRVIGFKLSRSF